MTIDSPDQRIVDTGEPRTRDEKARTWASTLDTEGD
jgi:hypothetical protein